MLYEALSTLFGLPSSLGIVGELLIASALIMIMLLGFLFILEFILSPFRLIK